ncbi:hypothetical protein CASFOL_009191 [Castilleja foliolosa]|uniref:Uncharacterized protein n=1 Tax=Castilleja foliolosa TaxID=1961234 RepID=A0ABD3DX51_9LAMI
MDVCFASDTPACRDISSIRISMSDIKICPTEFVSVEDIEMPTSGFGLFAGDSNKCNVVREYEQGDSDNRKTVNPASEKPFSNTVTFLALAEPISFLDGFEGEEKVQKSFKTSEVNESSESVNEGKLRLTSLPALLEEKCDTILPGIPLKHISALKGSREKQLMAPKNLSVTWAPDVYDPTPRSVSHALSSRNQRGMGRTRTKGVVVNLREVARAKTRSKLERAAGVRASRSPSGR